MEDVAELKAEIAALQAELARVQAELAKYTHCWHCHVELLEDDPHGCDSCPEWGCCDNINCEAPGCEEDVKAYHS